MKPVITFPRFRVVEEGQLPTPEDPEALEAQRQAEDQAQVDDFNYRLKINLGQVGGGLRSVGRRQQSARKPAEGWSIVVKPYGTSSLPSPPAVSSARPKCACEASRVCVTQTRAWALANRPVHGVRAYCTRRCGARKYVVRDVVRLPWWWQHADVSSGGCGGGEGFRGLTCVCVDGGAGRNDETEPYVATPGGGKRELNDDEKALIMMEKYKQIPKKKSLLQLEFQEEV